MNGNFGSFCSGCTPLKLTADIGYDVNEFIKNICDGLLGCLTCTSPKVVEGEVKAERGSGGALCCGRGNGGAEESIGRVAYQEW